MKLKQAENGDLVHKSGHVAERKLTWFPVAPNEMPEKNFKNLLQELQVHQIEMEKRYGAQQ